MRQAQTGRIPTIAPQLESSLGEAACPCPRCNLAHNEHILSDTPTPYVGKQINNLDRENLYSCAHEVTFLWVFQKECPPLELTSEMRCHLTTKESCGLHIRHQRLRMGTTFINRDIAQKELFSQKTNSRNSIFSRTMSPFLFHTSCV